jgi:hypothetical protein
MRVDWSMTSRGNKGARSVAAFPHVPFSNRALSAHPGAEHHREMDPLPRHIQPREPQPLICSCQRLLRFCSGM